MAASEACACVASLLRTTSSVARGSGSPLASNFKRGSSSKSSCMCRRDSGKRYRVPRPECSVFGSSRNLRALRCRRALSAVGRVSRRCFPGAFPDSTACRARFLPRHNPPRALNSCVLPSKVVQASTTHKGGRKGSKKAPWGRNPHGAQLCGGEGGIRTHGTGKPYA